jgi:acylphosphatase
MGAKHLIIHGQVQGVFYRGWTVHIAESLGLTGWVRNRRDGTVEAIVSGEDPAIERFIGLAYAGPEAARVARIDTTDEAEADFTRFVQRPTA